MLFSRQSLNRIQLFATPWTVAHQTPLSMGLPRQEYCSELSYPPPGDLPNSGVKPMFPALQVDSLPLNHQGNLHIFLQFIIVICFSIAWKIKSAQQRDHCNLNAVSFSNPFPKSFVHSCNKETYPLGSAQNTLAQILLSGNPFLLLCLVIYFYLLQLNANMTFERKLSLDKLIYGDITILTFKKNLEKKLFSCQHTRKVLILWFYILKVHEGCRGQNVSQYLGHPKILNFKSLDKT